MLDLAQQPALGIRRSLPAVHPPGGLRELLLPRPRQAWFFEKDEGAPDESPDDIWHWSSAAGQRGRSCTKVTG